MRLAVCLIFLFLAQATASVRSQTITLSGKNLPLTEVFAAIKKQTGYVVAYNRQLLQNTAPVSIKVRNLPLAEFLDTIFSGRPLKYEIAGETILVTAQKTPPSAEVRETPVSPPVTGRVTDSLGMPLPGASVSLKGKTLKTVTDGEGRFTIDAMPGDMLIISFVGYDVHMQRVTEDTATIHIRLAAAITSMQEVAVVSTGYQSIPKERATGAFTQIDNTLLNRRVGANVLDRLDGVAGGVIFNRTNITDEPLSIRGRSTLLGAQAATPLIVVDNFPYEGDFNNINPNDIENITILKDAAAASIWGAKSGNGVIVITTKQGRINQPLKISFNSNITIGNRPDLFYRPDVTPAADYIDAETELFNRGYFNSILSNTTTWQAVSPVVEMLEKQRNGDVTKEEADEYINALRGKDVRHDFLQHVYRRSVNQQYAISMQGGSNRAAYMFSAGFDDNRDNIVKNGLSRFTLNTQNTFHPARNLEITAGITYVQTKSEENDAFTYKYPATLMRGNLPMYPYASFQDEQGLPAAIIKDLRPVYLDRMEDAGFLDWRYRILDEIALADNRLNRNNFLAKVSARYKITKGLDVLLQYQHQREQLNGNYYDDAQSYVIRDLVNQYTQVNTTSGALTYPFPKGGRLRQHHYTLGAGNFRGQLNFNRAFGEHHAITALAGAELREVKTSDYTRTSYGFDKQHGTAVTNLDYVTTFPTNPSFSARLPLPSGDVLEGLNRFISYFMNGAYTYRERYTFSISGRRDGANLFGVRTNQKITPLWSAGLAWHLGNERFYNWEAVPYLKVRATYGYNGNVYNGTAYLTARYGTSALTGARTAVVANVPNPDLRWERVKNINFGIDFSTKSGIVSGSVDVYRKDGLDLIESAMLAPSSGFSSFTGNAASTRTNGVDLMINTRNIDRAFKWQTVLLFNYAKDRVTALDKNYLALNLVQGISGSLMALEGKPLFGVYSYPWAGLDPENGDPMGYLDKTVSKDYRNLLNGTAIEDMIFHGSARPVVFGSLRNDFQYGGFSLSANIVFRFDYYFRRASTGTNLEDAIGAGGHVDMSRRWRQPGDELHTNIPSMAYPANANRSSFYRYSSVLVEKGDHIRLQDIQLAYDLRTLKGMPALFKTLQVYSYLNNIGILWRANKLGIDPDTRAVPPAPFSFSIGVRTVF